MSRIDTLLNTIGTSYLISYLYGKYIDPNECSWQRRPSDHTHTIEESKGLYCDMIESVLNKNPNLLSKNEIGLSGAEVLRMANELETFFASRSAVTLHITSNSFITLSDFLSLFEQIDSGIHEYAYMTEGNCGQEETKIAQMRNGSIVVDLIVGVSQQLLSAAIKHIAEKIRNQIRQKKEEIIVVEEVTIHNQININILYERN